MNRNRYDEELRQCLPHGALCKTCEYTWIRLSEGESDTLAAGCLLTPSLVQFYGSPKEVGGTVITQCNRYDKQRYRLGETDA